MSEATMTDNATQAAATPEPGPGAALQEERRRQSLSLTDVARQLKLAPRQVEALERDDFAALPGPVFVRGFLRNYARLLGLDPEPMVRTAERLMAPAAGGEGETKAVASLERGAAVPVVDAGGGEPRSRWPLYLVSVAVILVTGYLATRDRTPQPSSMDVPVAITPSEPAAPAPAPETTAAATAPVPQPAAAHQQAPTPAPAAVVPAPEPPTPSAPAATATSPAAPAPQASPAPSPPVRTVGSSGPAIRMTFSRESWVEVRDRDGNVIFGQLNPAGSIRVVRGQPPLSIVVGNASGVSLTYNGKTVDLAPHTRTDVARLTLE